MAGTMAFYNGMEPGITKLVSSLAGDEAARKGYAKAAEAENHIASARLHNAEAGIKQSEYADTDKNALNYVAGQHGLTVPDIQKYHRNITGALNPGEAPTTYSPEDSAKYNPAIRDYGAFKSGKFSDVAKGTTEMTQLPSVQGAVRSAAEIANSPGATGMDKLRAYRGATNGSVSLDAPQAPNEVQIADWYQKATPAQRQAFTESRAASRSPGVSVNNFSGGFQNVVGPDGKEQVVQVGKDGTQRVIGNAPQPMPTLNQIIAGKVAAASQPAAPAQAPVAAPAQPQAQPINTSRIPKAAIDRLKANPAERTLFEKTYGAGTAAAVGVK